MPPRITPSKGSKPNKLFRDALLVVVNREDAEDGKKAKKIDRLASKLVSLALAGDTQAIKEIRDTLDGKPAQSIALGQDPDKDPITFRWEK